MNSSHLDQAMRNWRTWMDSWNLTNTCSPWPDNVTFYPRALEEAGQCVEGSVDAVRRGARVGRELEGVCDAAG